MKHFSRLLFVFFTMAIVTGCGQRLSHTNYRLECSISDDIAPDSVSLMILNDSYGKVVYHMATVARDSLTGAFVFEGQIEQPSVAYLKFGTDSTSLFFFVLEHGESTISISQHGLQVSAGELNHEYMDYLKTRQTMLAARQAVHNEYLKQASSDSLISITQERQFMLRDSLLCDSLQRITLEAINRDNAASRIIYDRYVETLPRHYLRQVVIKVGHRSNN